MLLMTDSGALDAVDRLSHTTLHVTVKKGHLEIVEALLAANANANALNNFGWKASDLSTGWGHHHIAQILLSAEGKFQTGIIPFKRYSSIDGWRFREWDELDDHHTPNGGTRSGSVTRARL